jgi:6-phosphofructokinase 1
MWVVREGYEGLVRGNSHATQDEVDLVNTATQSTALDRIAVASVEENAEHSPDQNLTHNLRFGDGELLKDGTAEYVGGRTLKGRYILRVGWDDVRGWYSQVGDKGTHLPRHTSSRPVF